MVAVNGACHLKSMDTSDPSKGTKKFTSGHVGDSKFNENDAICVLQKSVLLGREQKILKKRMLVLVQYRMCLDL